MPSNTCTADPSAAGTTPLAPYTLGCSRRAAGEYIAVEKVEGIYKKNTNLEQVGLHTNT